MPLVRIDLVKGQPSAYRLAICGGVYRAMSS
jgi:phenylpyruvate tautomerase PptA (4-oxalocrotonate tautomerase family)